MKLEVARLQARLRAPMVSSHGSFKLRPLALVTLTGADGIVGHGEAAPLASYDGVSMDDVLSALEDCRAVLAGAEGTDHQALVAAVREAAVLPQAVAAIDLALWDLAGRRAGVPVWRLLDGAPGGLDVNATIAVPDRAGAAAAAVKFRRAGFRCVKVKVGIGDDAGRVAAVRAAAGPEMAIRLDAGGAWSVDVAVGMLRALAPAGIELCEEPVAGLDGAAAVSRSGGSPRVPVALDESAALPGALDRRVCDAVCLKITRSGGISGLIADAARARSAGYEVYIASTVDGPLGIAAALDAATAIRPDRPCGLATLSMFDGRPDPLPPIDGRMAAPASPGLGVDIGWYR